MQMEAFLWLFLPVFVAGGSALLSFYIMQAKLEVAISKERESLAEARATIGTQKVTLEERIKATEESTKRLALDEFMHDFRVEERSYVRESKTATSSKKSMVMQERLFFRNIPLSNWIEREMVVEEGTDLHKLPRESVFTQPALSSGHNSVAVIANQCRNPAMRVDEVPVATPRAGSQPRSLVSVYMAAFGGH